MFSGMFNRYKELNWLAYHDSLTKLKNRNWLYKNHDTIQCKFIYFIDINDLHEMNKKGHTFGDRHICLIVEFIEPQVDIDFIRYAGDEFIVFSDINNLLETNKLFSVGKSFVGKDLFKSIDEADANMIAEKAKYKASKNDKSGALQKRKV